MPELKPLLEPISRHVAALDLKDAAAAEASLNARFPPGSPAMKEIEKAAREALAAGTICDREGEGVRYSRVVKPKDDAAGCSIDAVHMTSSTGPFHTHLKGEVCLCLPDDAAATFEGRRATWIVLPSGSRHAPTVKNGSMLILYWWPEGAVAWG